MELASKLNSNCGKVLTKELSDMLLRISTTLPRALSLYVEYEVIKRVEKVIEEVATSILHPINLYEEALKFYATFGSREGGYGIVRDFIDRYDPKVWQVAYVTSGVVMVSDTLAATVERRGKVKGLARSLLGELGVTIKELDVILKSSLKTLLG